MEIHIFYHSSNGSNYFSSSVKLKYNEHLRVFVTKCCSFGTHKEPYCKWAILSTTACCQDHTTTTTTIHTWCLQLAFSNEDRECQKQLQLGIFAHSIPNHCQSKRNNFSKYMYLTMYSRLLKNVPYFHRVELLIREA